MTAAEESGYPAHEASVFGGAGMEEWEILRYRTLAEKLLQRYFRASVELGRLPAPLGKGAGMMRAKVSAHKVTTFEDTMILVCDVEKCVKRLDAFEQVLVLRIAMQEYTHEEAAEVMRCAVRTVERRYPEALEKLALMFLERELLRPV